MAKTAPERLLPETAPKRNGRKPEGPFRHYAHFCRRQCPSCHFARPVVLCSRMLSRRPCKPLLNAARRGYAITAPGGPGLQVFNRNTKWLQRERAAADAEASRKVDYLRDEVAARLSERLLVCQKHCVASQVCANIARRISTAPSTTSSTLAQTLATSHARSQSLLQMPATM